MNQEKKEGLQQALLALASLGGLGIFLTLVLGISIYIGSAADEILGIHPVGKALGIAFGFPCGIYLVWRNLRGKKIF